MINKDTNNTCYGCNKTENELSCHFKFLCNCCRKAGFKLKKDNSGHFLIVKPDGSIFHTRKK